MRSRIEDAIALWQAGRYESSLLLALVAAAGTSRVRYPVTNGFKSADSLSKFLEDERLVLIAGGVLNMNMKIPGAEDPKYPGGLVPWHEALAIFLRNQLLHDGKLRPDVSIGDLEAPTFDLRDNKLVMSPYVVLCLIRLVEVAPENRGEWPEIDKMSDDELLGILFPGKKPIGHVLDYMRMRQGRFKEERFGGGGPDGGG